MAVEVVDGELEGDALTVGDVDGELEGEDVGDCVGVAEGLGEDDDELVGVEEEVGVEVGVEVGDVDVDGVGETKVDGFTEPLPGHVCERRIPESKPSIIASDPACTILSLSLTSV